jgi:hypothetical protein
MGEYEVEASVRKISKTIFKIGWGSGLNHRGLSAEPIFNQLEAVERGSIPAGVADRPGC